ncbi:MAG: hypothetical protein ABIK28_20715 [Planctomycetota bacterium]
MHPLNQDPSELIPQFESMDRALIDASSMIYLSKAGCFDRLGMVIRLHALAEIIEEAGECPESVLTVRSPYPRLSNDEKLIACAVEMQLPVITEDRRIVLRLAGKNHPVFNALMMLCFLAHKKAVDGREYSRFLEALEKVAWYGPKVWEFGRRVYEQVLAAGRKP